MSDPTMIKAIKDAVTIPSWPRRASGTSSRRRCWKPWGSTTSTSPRCSPRGRD
jgi:hypothetical protein